MQKSLHLTAWILITAALATWVGASTPRNLPKAIEAQLELQRQHPQDPKIANDLGNLLVLAHRVTEAEIAYIRALELAPGDAVPLYNLGLLQQRQGRIKEALGSFKSVVKQDPGNAWTHYQVGSLYEALGEKPRAVAAYGRAFVLNPELASSDINPQVIESKWVIEALLDGYQEALQQPLAPQAYGDPNRIAMLMISSDENQPAQRERDELGVVKVSDGRGEEPALSQVEGEDLTAAPTSRGRPPASGDTSSRRRDRKVLTSDSIERGGTLGQVGSSGSSRTNRSRATSRSNSRRRGNLTATRRNSAATTQGTALNPNRRSTGRVRYRPSTRSTGSLDLELIPAQDLVVPAG